MSECSVQSVRCGAQGGVGEQKTTNMHYEKHTAGTKRIQDKECSTRKAKGPRALGAGGVARTIRMCTTRPAVEDLPGRSPPNLCGNRRLQTLIDRLRCDRTPSSRNPFGECAKNGDGTSVWPAVGAPYERRVFNIMPLQST